MENTENIEVIESNSDPKQPENNKLTYEEIESELAKVRAEKERLKTSLDHASSEAADYKKRLRERQTEDEKAAELQKERDAYVAGLEKQIKTSEATQRYISLGMNAQMAAETAQFEVDGDFTNVTANLAKHQSSIADAERAKWLQSRPPQNATGDGNAQGEITMKEFSRMGYKDRLALKQAQPDVYAELIKGE